MRETVQSVRTFATGFIQQRVRPDAIALPAEMEGLSVLMGIRRMGVTMAILVFMFLFWLDR